MDMFDFSSIIELAKVEPGHGLLQSILLFMIWWQSRGLRKEVTALGQTIFEVRSTIEVRFNKIEGRLNVLERGIK